MEKKEFQAESKRLLDLMIHSIYTHQEIFLREILSNASDAIDKLAYRALTDENVGLSRSDFVIRIEADKDARTLTVRDNGIGMSKDEMEQNLGTICKSGSLQFKKDLENAESKDEDIDIIGQFGVGFYSAFMVADEVTVISKKYGETQAWKWQSSGADGYTIEPCEKDGVGTDVIMKLKADTEDEDYSRFLKPWDIQTLVRKYSDYIRYPIKMMMDTTKVKEGTADSEHPEYETVQEDRTLNSMVPIWQKKKSEVTDEEYNSFYKEKFYDFEDPVAVIHADVEGAVTYKALLYVPAKAPYDFYTKDFKKGLQLYSSGVMIMDKCADLLPDHFRFVRGVVDSADFSLNISREVLQHTRQLKVIATALEKKIKSELLKMQKDDKEKYEKFWHAFGTQLKYGVVADYGAKKDLLQDLLLFPSSKDGKLVSLKEYVDRMPEGQDKIYYAAGESVARIESLPQTEQVKDKGYEILYFTENVDEFAVRMMQNYQDKQFQSVLDSNLDLESEEEKKELEEKQESSKDMLEEMKKALEGKVGNVKLSGRLKSHPVCLSSEGELSMEMAKTLNAMPGTEGQKLQAQTVLEINPEHPIYQRLMELQTSDTAKLDEYAKLLYDQALLIAGMPVEDPVAFSNRICDLM